MRSIVIIPNSIAPVDIDAGFVKMRVAMQAAGYEVGIDMKAILREVADKLATSWKARANTGAAVDGGALHPLTSPTKARRRRRGSPDLTTPMHESGRYAKSIRVRQGKGGVNTKIVSKSAPDAVKRYGVDALLGVSQADGGSVQQIVADAVQRALDKARETARQAAGRALGG